MEPNNSLPGTKLPATDPHVSRLWTAWTRRHCSPLK